jgi:hypothetical protein
MNLAGINKVPVASALTATPTVAQVEADAKLLLGLITRFPVLGVGAEWRFAPRTWLYLSMLRGADDQKIYPEMERGGNTGVFYGRLVFVAPTGRLWLDGVQSFSGSDQRDVLGQAQSLPEGLLEHRLRRLVTEF